MAGFTATEWIAAKPAEVFAFVMNTKNAPKVIRGVKSMVQIGNGAVGVGTRFRETRLIKGKEHVAEIEITAYEPPQRYSASAEQSGVRVTYHYIFTPEKEGTRARLECEISAGGLKKLAIPLVTAAMKKEDGDHLQNLKRVIEEPK